MRKDKGFTLVELVVSMVLSSILISGIGIYTIISIRNFRDARAETMAQNESQIVMMALKDKFKSAQDYVEYVGDNIYAVEVLYGDGTDSSYKTYDIAYIFDLSNTDLYIYNGGESDALGIDFSTLNVSNLRRTGLISSYVTNFNVWPGDKGSSLDDIAYIEYDITVGKYTYNQSFNINTRND